MDWTLPYPSRRQPVCAANVVATSQPLATQAGVAMLARGGNAVDAALATAITLTVVEPCSNGIGSDLFAILWDGATLAGLNASGRAPAAWSRERFAAQSQMPQRGWESVTIPGAVSGWVELSKRYGKLPFEDLFEPGIRYARDGYAVSPVIADKWRLAEPIMPKGLGWQDHFLIDGHVPAPGERFASSAMAATLAQIAATRGEAFYRGALADAMVRHAQANGAAHAHRDFERHSVDWVTPIAVDYRDVTVHEIPPNGQGIAALMALGMLQSFDIGAMPPDSVAAQHLQIEAMKLAFADAHRYVSDPATMTVSPQALLDGAYLRERARLIDPSRAQTFGPGAPPRAGTVYICAADASGMMVSLIQSNYMGFGSGVVVPGTGISLQNRGFGFSMDPRSQNAVAPGRRPFHTIIPGFLTQHGQAVMSFGVMGGDIQPQGHVQTLVRMIDYRQQPQAACDAPRWRVNPDFRIDVEHGTRPELIAGLKKLGHAVNDDRGVHLDFGAGQFIWRLPAESGGNYVAASDPRRDGQAAGF
jgi:gamma-glutamyltranspeptidase/glutathione hydrolase